MPAKQRQVSQNSKGDDSSKSLEKEGVSFAEYKRAAARKTGAKKKDGRCRSLLKTLGYFSLIFIIPAILNYAALNQEARALIPEGGVLYDIGWGQKLLLRCSGDGLPTVVLEAPIGQTSDAWSLIQPIIARKTRVCSYDRAGLGFSERGYKNTSEYANDYSDVAKDRDKTQPSTVERMADDLHRLLSYSSNQPKPLLLVSVDFSTLISRFYTQLYEHEVAGLFLIEPAIETLLDYDHTEEPNDTPQGDTESQLKWPEYWNTKLVPSSQGQWLSASVGFTRLELILGLRSPVEEPSLKDKLPSDVVLRKKHFLCQPKHLSAQFEELYHMNQSMNQLKTVLRVKPFPSELPITIATFREGDTHSSPQLHQAWTDGHNMLSNTLLPDSKRIVLPGSDYLTLYHNPQHVASAILSLVDKWRKDYKASA